MYDEALKSCQFI
jgi:tetratricopeptide repeat protein 30